MNERTVHVDTSSIVGALKELSTRANNMSEVNAQFAQILHLAVEDKFLFEGPGWPELSDATLNRRRASTSPKMLQDTGDMVNSLQPASGPDFSEVFTNKAYARYHLDGDGVPKRDFFDLDMDKQLNILAQMYTTEIAR